MANDPGGAEILLHTADGQVLLHKRDKNAPIYKGYWALFGGRMEPSDNGDPGKTACRELREELCGFQLSPDSLQPLCRVKVVRGNEFPVVHYFVALLNVTISGLSLKNEGDAIGLFSSEEIDRLPMRPEDKLAVERYFQGEEFGYVQ